MGELGTTTMQHVAVCVAVAYVVVNNTSAWEWLAGGCIVISDQSV